jgi:hypothetical protein
VKPDTDFSLALYPKFIEIQWPLIHLQLLILQPFCAEEEIPFFTLTPPPDLTIPLIFTFS